MGTVERGALMAKRLYVGNLGYSVTAEQLQALFEEHGRVKSVQVMIDRETGRGRGFGFVEMEDAAEADVAVQSMDGNDYLGRRLNINEANPRLPGDGDRGRGNAGDRRF